MRNIDEIIINKVIINVLDRENDRIVASNSELELTEEVFEYFERHILKSIKDDGAFPAKFDERNNIAKQLCEEIFKGEEPFHFSSAKLSQYFFKCMKNDEKEGSGDLAVCEFESQEGRYLAILKLDFVNSYSHYIKNDDEKIYITVTRNSTGLPGTAQKVQKAALVIEGSGENLFDLLVIDKEPEGYFTQAFLKCIPVRDNRENTKLIHKVSESFVRKNLRDNVHEAENFRNKFTEILRTEDKIDIEKVAEITLSDKNIREEYKAALKSEGIDEKELSIDREWAEKKLKRKRLKIDKSIELYIDSDVYNDKDKFEVKRNGDGTIDIILKNVKNYIEK